MASLGELRRLINESPLPNQTKQWALRRASTFKRQSKLQEWTNKFKNIIKERPPINTIGYLKRYVPVYVKVTLNLFQTAHDRRIPRNTRSIVDPVQRWGTPDAMFASENDTEVLLPKHFIDAYPRFQVDGMTFLGQATRTFGDLFKNVEDFITLAQAVAPDESKDTLSNIQWSANSKDVDGLLQLVSVHAIPNQRYNLRALRDRPLRANDRRLAHPWLEYEADLLATSFEEMFEKPKYYYDQGCMYAAIMNCWADQYNARKTRASNWLASNPGSRPMPDMTPESIHNLVHPGKPFQPSSNCPASQALTFYTYMTNVSECSNAVSVFPSYIRNFYSCGSNNCNTPPTTTISCPAPAASSITCFDGVVAPTPQALSVYTYGVGSTLVALSSTSGMCSIVFQSCSYLIANTNQTTVGSLPNTIRFTTSSVYGSSGYMTSTICPPGQGIYLYSSVSAQGCTNLVAGAYAYGGLQSPSMVCNTKNCNSYGISSPPPPPLPPSPPTSTPTPSGSCNTAACSGCTSCAAAQTCASSYYCTSNQYVTNFQCSIVNNVGSWSATCATSTTPTPATSTPSPSSASLRKPFSTMFILAAASVAAAI
jgi:hypothetical protein